MTEIRIGYARCSTDRQDLAAQQEALVGLGVSPDRIYTDKGLTGSNRQRPGLAQALAAVRQGDTLVVPKMFFNVLATFAEFEGDLIRLRTREEMAIAWAKGKLRGSSRSCQINSRKSFAGCTEAASTLSAIWLNYSPSPAPRSIGRFPVGNND